MPSNAGGNIGGRERWHSFWVNENSGAHVRLRRVGTIFSSHDGPGDIPTVAVTAMVTMDQQRVRIRRVNNGTPGLAVEEESEVDDDQS